LLKERSELNRYNDARLRLSGDRPKEHLADDRLGYARFAQSLARSIADLAPTEGIVLAVNGPWGSGKTTAVNMIVEAVGALQRSAPSGREILPIRFNPWWFSEQEDLIRQSRQEALRESRRGVSQHCAPHRILTRPCGSRSRAGARRISSQRCDRGSDRRSRQFGWK
jgi:predicted KAP-like P-loop ATPase